MLFPHFSATRPAFLKLFFQWGSFDIGLIRVRASPEFTTVTSTMSRLNFCTYINHCAKVKAKQKTLLNYLPQIDHDADGGYGDLVDVVDVVPVDVVLVDVIAGPGIDVKYHVVKSW